MASDYYLGERIYRSCSGATHSCHVATRGNRIVVRVWRNNTVHGDGDEQTLVIPWDLIESIVRGLETGKYEIRRAVPQEPPPGS